ncbi:PAS domain S-box protein [Desulfatirhabdium butyrativorans]|uniref:PAS domain S-box protein n=1 Tax=Desulfatirhabdium butyrativorans TaxID=340467 RepID=UPI0004203F47|nr:PAS domain S-box protein [Desulfatirhabdium butyrativorans]
MEWLTDQQKNSDESTIVGAQEVAAILNAVPQAFFLMKPDGTIIIANDAMASRLHLPLEAIQGMEAFELDPPDMARNRREMVRLVMATGRAVTFTDERDGQVFENRVCPLLNRAGEVSRIAFLSWDITRQTQREKALQQSQMLLNETQKLTHAGGWEWDMAARTMTWTDETYRIHGYSPDQYPQGSADLIQHSLKCYDPEDRPVIEEAFLRCAAEGRPYDLTVPFTQADGKRLWIRTIGIPVRDHGKIIKVIGNIVDITDQKQMANVLQARLRLSEAAATIPLEKLLQKFLDEAEVLTDSCTGFFHFFDQDNQTISLQTWSSNTLQLCQADGKGLHYPLDKSGVWADCIRERRPIVHNDYSTLPNRKGLPQGHAPVIRELVVPIFREGRIMAVFGVGNKRTAYDERDVEVISKLGDMAWDIVLRKQEEAALQESEARFRKIYEHMGIGVARISLDFRIECANDAYCRMLGYREEELIGKHLRDITHPEVIAENLAKQRQLGDGIIDHYRMEKRFIHKDGHTVYGLLNANLIRDAEGHPSYFLGSVADITERKQAEAEKLTLEIKNRQLQKAESLGRMAGAIAHHFNNQLYVVTGNLEMAIDDSRKGIASTDFLEAALQAAHRAADVCRMMLTYLGQKLEQHRPIDLSDTCRQRVSLLQAAIPQNILFETDFPSSGPIIRADSRQVQQVLLNLVSNARESISEDQGKIRLAIQIVSAEDIQASKRFPIDWQPTQPDYACLEVSDTGCGIAEKDIEKLFDPFFTTKFIGRGLGLPVVGGILKAHGGAITVTSEPGRGTTMRAYFPLMVSNSQ